MARSTVVSMTGSKTCVRVVEAVAEAEGVAPNELRYQLYDYIDPDALRRLEDSENSEWSLQFKVADHRVTVDSTGEITVDGTEYR